MAVGLACGPARAGHDPVAAGRAIARSCDGCHDADGGSQPSSAGVLARLDAGYLAAQLAAFAAGTRQNAAMADIVKALDATARADVAAYYASLPPPNARPPEASLSEPRAQIAAGAELAGRGDWDARIPPCVSCHGPGGRGVGAAFPAIAGQSASYIAAQLKAWKSGTRHDDPQGLMRTVAGRMSDAQVAAVSAYYATLPATGAASNGAPR